MDEHFEKKLAKLKEDLKKMPKGLIEVQ